MTPGDSIAGKYRLLRPLGKGSMGEVWAAVHTEMRREVALKLIYGDNPDLAVRLKREAQACGRLEHPNVVRIYDIGETDDGDPFLIMQLLTGETLADRLARRRRLPPAEALGIALDIARALRAAHAANIVHRDLKPANIYLHRGVDSEGEEVKVLDFGVSKILSVGDLAFTVTGALVGSPAYMSPEQARATKEIDPRADVWALGVLLFEMLAGRRPFPSASPMGVIAEILSEPIPSLAAHVPGIDPRIEDVVNLCMTRDVDQRLQSASAFIDLLRPVLATMELASTGAGGRMLPSLVDLAALPSAGLRTPDPASVSSSSDDEIETRMIDRSALLQSAPPPRPLMQLQRAPPPPGAPSSEATSRLDAPPAWSRPVPPPSPSSPPLSGVIWPSQSNPAIDTMMASSDLMHEREARVLAATPAAPRLLAPPRPFSDTSSTIPLLHAQRSPAVDVAPAPMPLSWEPPPARDRTRIALIVAVVVIALSLVTLLLLMLTQDPPGAAPGSPEAASAAASVTPPVTPVSPPEAPPAMASIDAPAPAPPEARTARPAEKRLGIVNIASTPSTRVLLDGQQVGTTPIIGLSVPLGAHRLTFIRSARETKTITINVKADQRTTASVKFD
jgi:serine/threonine-protein kinase